MSTYDQLKHDLEGYSEQSEQILRDHRLAMAVLDFEVFLLKGLQIYERIRFLEERSRTLPATDEEREAVEATLEGLYEFWLRPCPKLLQDLEFFERHFEVRNAAEFRRACEAAEKLLYSAPASAPQIPTERLLKIAERNPPPQAWYDETESGCGRTAEELLRLKTILS